MNAETTIREAGPEDAPEVARLLGELGYPATTEEVRARWAAQAESRAFVLVVAEGAELAGMLSFAQVPLLHASGWLGRVTLLVVDARRRGQGLGKRLLRAMEERAWAQGCLRVEITSGDFRTDAHAFYEHAGYTPDERRFIRRRPTL